MKKDWHGILKIEEFKVFEKNELILIVFRLRLGNVAWFVFVASRTGLKGFKVR